MGCGASSNAHGQAPPTRLGRVSANGGLAVAANAVLPYYDSSVLGSRDVYGPFLKLQSYHPEAGSYELSALVVCTEGAQQRLKQDAGVVLTWHERAGPSDAAGASTDVAGEMVAQWRQWRFWRFRFSTTCSPFAKTIQYQVNLLPGPTYTVAVPAYDEPWHWAFCTCNGLHSAKDYERTGGVTPLWKDLMARHQDRPLHALVAGGDQIYNDGVFSGPLFKGWDESQGTAQLRARTTQPFTGKQRAEVEDFYFSHYVFHMGQPVYSDALASIPVLSVWNDHEIVDGWGSYPEDVMHSPVMLGLCQAAQMFYLLFQHHTTEERLMAEGYWCGSSFITCLGNDVAVVMPDTRTYRSQSQVMPPDFYGQLGSRLRQLPPSVRHVVMVLAVPILYPKLPVQETLQMLGDVAGCDPDELLGAVMQKTGLSLKVVKRFGMTSNVDDIIDHWSSKQHCAERDDLLRLLMRVSDDKAFRVSCLSGDVRCAGYGMFHPRHVVGRAAVEEDGVEDMPLPDMHALAAEPRFIPQIISSAMGNVPPPAAVLKALQLAGRKPGAILEDCVQRMVPLFGPPHDIDSTLHGQRNWCEVCSGGPEGDLHFRLRCEKELGSGAEQVEEFHIRVPPLRR